jgi:hypothetical protein
VIAAWFVGIIINLLFIPDTLTLHFATLRLRSVDWLSPE